MAATRGRMGVRVVPWFSALEWKETYRLVYSESWIDRERGLQRLLLWKSRSQSKLPTGIECTLYLLQSLLKAEEERRHGRMQDRDVSLMFAMSLVRFLNHVSQLGQNMPYPQSLSEVAVLMDIPEWLVSLRNEATHEHMPTFQVLESGVQVALRWLQDHYWETEIPEMTLQQLPSQENAECSPQLAETLHHYFTAQFYSASEISITDVSNPKFCSHVKALAKRSEMTTKLYHMSNKLKRSKKKPKETLNIHTAVKLLWDDLQKSLSRDKNEVVACLMSGNTFIPTSDVWDTFASPADFVRLWNDLIVRLHLLRFIPMLIHSLVKITLSERESPWRKTMAVTWLQELPNMLLTPPKQPEVEASNKRKRKKNSQVNGLMPHKVRNGFTKYELQKLIQTVEMALEEPNELTLQYLSEVMKLLRPHLENEVVTKLESLVKVYQGETLEFEAEFESKEDWLSLEDITAKEKQQYLLEVDADNSSPWHKYEDNPGWSRCPIGVLPWQKDCEDLNLEIPGITWNLADLELTPDEPSSCPVMRGNTSKKRSSSVAFDDPDEG